MPLLGLAGKVALNAGVKAVGGIVDKESSKYLNNAPSVATLVDRLAKGMQVSSLVDVSRPARVAPLVLMEDSLRHCEDISSVLQTICSIFSGYYLQAFNLVASPNRVETLRVLDSLNPHRGGGSMVGEDGRTPISINLSAVKGTATNMIGNESYRLMTASQEAGEDKPATALYEQQNLAVGKLLCLDLETNMIDVARTAVTSDKDSAKQTRVTVTETPRSTSQKVYVMVTVSPILTRQDYLVGLYGKINRPTGLSDRWQLFRSGALRFRELMTGSDIIDQHRKLLATDDSRLYERMRNTRKKNAMAAIKTGIASMADCSNITIISSETEKQIARELNGKLSSPRVRNIIFEATYLMLLVVVNENFGQVTIYTRGIADPIVASIRDLKTYERNKGPDITEILATYVKATAPTL